MREKSITLLIIFRNMIVVMILAIRSTTLYDAFFCDSIQTSYDIKFNELNAEQIYRRISLLIDHHLDQ